MMEDETKDSYLVKLFNEFDTRGTGYLEQDQLKQTVCKITGRSDFTDEELSTLLNKFDTDKDGRISLEEFLSGCNSNSIVDEEDIQTYISTSNNNSSYKSSSNLNNLSTISTPILNGNRSNGIHHDRLNNDDDEENQEESEKNSMMNEIGDLSNDQEKHLKFIFSLFDKDGDGLVSIEQLRNMLEDIKVKSIQDGEGDQFDNDNDDDDIDYIINTLSADGSKTISFENFMKAIEQINSPSQSAITGSPMHNDTTVFDGPHSDTELEDADNNNNNNTDNKNNSSRPDSPVVTSPDKKSTRNRGRTGSWVAPVAIVNMIKRRTDLYSKDQIQVFDSNDSLADKYKKEAAMLRTEKEHLGSKLHLFEGQLKEARESQEKLSEDNAQLKESITIGKKTLIENQKLSNHNKKLQEHIEDLKKQLLEYEDQKTELVKTQNRIKLDKEQIYQELQQKEKDLKEKEESIKELQQQHHQQLTHSSNAILQSESNDNNNNNANGNVNGVTTNNGENVNSNQNGVNNTSGVNIEIDVNSVSGNGVNKIQDGLDLRSALMLENEKAQETIKFLTEELKRHQIKSKGDRELIQKLKISLEEAQSNTISNSDPNLRLSLLSELEHQVEARLGSTPLNSSFMEQFIDQQQSPLSQRSIIKKSTSKTSSLDEDGDLILNDDDDNDDNEEEKEENNNNNNNNNEIKQLKSTLEIEIKLKKELMELVEQSKNDNQKLEQMTISLKQLNLELTEKHQQQTSQLSKMVEDLQTQKEQLNQQVILLQQSNQVNNQELLKSIDQLQQSINDKQKQYDQTITDLTGQSNSEKLQFQSQIQSLKSDIDQINQLKKEHQDQLQLEKDELLSQQQKLQQKIEQYEQQQQQQPNQDEEIQQLKQMIESNEDENEKLLKRIEQLEFENQKMVSQQQIFAKSIETPSNLSDPINIKAGQTQNELSSLKQRLEELAKNNNLISENTQLKNSLTPVDSPSSSQREIPTTNNNNNNNNDNDNDIYNLVKSTSATSIENLQNEISTLNTLNQQLQNDLKKYESKAQLQQQQLQHTNSANNLVDELKKANEITNEKFRTLEYENLMVKEDNKDLQNKNQLLQDKIDSMKVEFENNLNQVQINEKKSKLIKEIDDLKAKLKKYENDSDHHQIEMEDETKALKDRIDDLSNKLQNEKNLTKHLQSQLNSVNSESDDQAPLMGGHVKQKKRGCCTIQ
ncbi:hypothetical protein ACTA71_010801 [Dictyostelium dimigraforme]